MNVCTLIPPSGSPTLVLPFGDGPDVVRIVREALPWAFMREHIPGPRTGAFSPMTDAESALLCGSRDLASLRYAADHYHLLRECYSSVVGGASPEIGEDLTTQAEVLGGDVIHVPSADAGMVVLSFAWLAVVRRQYGPDASIQARGYLAGWHLYLRRLDATTRAVVGAI